jgi:predicted ATPase/class 3 adenylate cyclase
VPALPAGTLTLLFSDIEGSTSLLNRLGPAWGAALSAQRRILRESFAAHGGVELGTEGDSFFVVFTTASEAVAAALQAQRGLLAHPWPDGVAVRARMGLHTGEPQRHEDGYIGIDVHRAARIMAAGHGGQVLASQAVHAVVAAKLPDGVELRDLGEHRLKDLGATEQIFQLVAPDLPDRFPHLVTLDRVVNNLPTQITSFLGRDEQLADVRALIDDPASRLVTLTGPGGTGKTRLALHAAAAQVDRFPDGVFLVDLSPDHDVEAALARIVRTIGVRRGVDDSTLLALKRDIGLRHMLLLLDNCEQIQRLGVAVAELLGACPRLTVLATSREALHVRGEQRYAVPPLALPPESASLPEIAESEAVRLFVARARESRADFVLDDSNAADVVAVCRRLDALPLALELAAARIRLFSAHELLSRLSLRMLRSGSSDLPDRQQTLDATIDWSYELLDERDQVLLQVFSVFVDADVASVEVLAAQSRLLDPADVLDGLDSLLTKSLLRSKPTPAAGMRLEMLQTIREYAAAKLEAAGRSVEARRSHASWASDLVARLGAGLSGPSREEDLARLGAELGNALEAWRYYVRQGDLARLNMMLEGIWALHQSRGWYHGSVELANDLLRLLAAQPPTPERVRQEVELHTSLARALMALHGYTDEVEAAIEHAVKSAAESDADPGSQQVSVLSSQASLHAMRGETPAVLEAARELLKRAKERDDPDALIRAHQILGAGLFFHGEPDEGLAHLDAAVALFVPSPMRSAGLSLGPHPGVVSLAASSLCLWWMGRPEQAAARARRADEASRAVGHEFTRAYALYHTAYFDWLQQDVDSMARRADELLLVANRNDYAIWRSLAMLLQSVALLAQGDPDAGVALMDRAVALYQSTSAPPVFWTFLLMLRSASLAGVGRVDEAGELADEVMRLIPEGSILFGEAALNKAQVTPAGEAAATEQARELCRQAITASGAFGLRMTELRACTRLALLAESEVQCAEAAASLGRAYGLFTEGFSSPALRAAATVLERLAGQ